MTTNLLDASEITIEYAQHLVEILMVQTIKLFIPLHRPHYRHLYLKCKYLFTREYLTNHHFSQIVIFLWRQC